MGVSELTPDGLTLHFELFKSRQGSCQDNFSQKVDPQGPFGQTKSFGQIKVYLGQKIDPQGPFGQIKLYFGQIRRSEKLHTSCPKAADHIFRIC